MTLGSLAGFNSLGGTMRVLVTGGSGRLGRFAIAELLAHGHEVVNADRRRPAGDFSERFVETDLTDVGQVAGALRGCEAAIHLGAIPAPNRHADEIVFGNNTRSTFAVLQAAALLGVRRAAIASSVSAYGMAWTPKPFAPRYVPLDEEHPLLPHDPYGLSKEADERTAEMFHRRTGMSVAALRFHWVAKPEELAANDPAKPHDPSTFANNLWGYVDARDAGAACRLSIEADDFGFEYFNITAADTLLPEPTEELVRRYLPETEVLAPITGRSSGFTIDKAARLLNWTPQYSPFGEPPRRAKNDPD
jgi:nucleoside-diphosphate-sugar epimerase